MISFSHPLFLGFLPFLLLIPFYFLKRRKKIKTSAFFPTSAFFTKKEPPILGAILFSILLLIHILILSDLKIPTKDFTIALVIDTSGSMKATDYKPSRMEAAKDFALKIYKKFQNKVGVITFDDYPKVVGFGNSLEEKIKGITYKENGGTAIGEGIATATSLLNAMGHGKKIIILISDGVNTSGEIPPLQAVDLAKKAE